MELLPQGGTLSNFQDGGDPTDVVVYPRQTQQEAIYRLLYHHAGRAGLFAHDFQDAKAAAVALHESGLPFVANNLGIEMGAIIDGDTNRIVSIVTDFMPSTVTIPAGYGDAVWHNHPRGTDPSWRDIESLAVGGRSWSFVSGTTLTGVNLRELPSTNPAVLRGLRDVVYPLHRYGDGEWSVKLVPH